jgi:Raf kinase inhibitor-like YbhB/YbcL family protein
MAQGFKKYMWIAVVGLACLASSAAAADLALSSSAFDNGDTIPEQYSCDGQGISPPLTISGVPDKAQSLALIVDDPDAPSGDWTHWVLYNLATQLVSLAPGASEQTLPGPASTAANSWHKQDYGGVCPPRGNGVHHYHFILYALDTRLADNLDDKAAVQDAMHGHVLTKAQLIGTYQRQ